MIDQLNTANLQKLGAELATGRIESLLRIGQSQVASVLEVTPQPARTASAQPQASTAQVRQTTQPLASAPDPRQKTTTNERSSAQTVNRQAASASANSSTASSSKVNNVTVNSSKVNNATVYRAKLNVEGRLLEIVTPKPLTPGSQISITREAGNRLSLTLPPAASPAAGQPGPERSKAATAQPAQAQNPSAGSAQTRGQPEPQAARPVPTAAAGGTNASNTASTTASNTASNSEMLVRPGERALARVLRVTTDSNSASAGQFRTTLELQGRPVDVLTPRPLTVGSEVRVRQDGNGQVTVEIPRPRTEALEQALRRHLPQQQPPTQLLNLLADPQHAAPLSKAQPLLQSLVQMLLGRSLADPRHTDADGLRQQLLNSGSQLEHRLARGDTQSLQHDHKALLMKLDQQLAGSQPRPLPQPLGQQITQMTQQAISRVLYNQVSSLLQQPQDSGAEQIRHLAMDVPVLWQGRNENLQLRISAQPNHQQPDDEQDQQQRWQVQLRFQMEAMPPMGADLTLDGQSISVLWFGDRATRQLLEPNLSQLQQLLEDAGLEVTTLAVREQSAAGTAIHPPRQRLIDIKT